MYCNIKNVGLPAYEMCPNSYINIVTGGGGGGGLQQITRQLTLESLKKLGDSIIRVASKYVQFGDCWYQCHWTAC